MCFSQPKPVEVAAPPPVAVKQDASVQDAMERERQRQRKAMFGLQLNLTGGKGLTTPATTSPKTLLGE